MLEASTGTCSDALDRLHDLPLGRELSSGMNKATVTVVSISGNSATVRAVVGSRTANVPLSKADAGWVIDRLNVVTPRPLPTKGLDVLEHQLAAGGVR
jgi:hypothetical protein